MRVQQLLVGRAQAALSGPQHRALGPDLVGRKGVVVEEEQRHDGTPRTLPGPRGKRVLRRQHAIALAERDQALVVRDAALLGGRSRGVHRS